MRYGYPYLIILMYERMTKMKINSVKLIVMEYDIDPAILILVDQFNNTLLPEITWDTTTQDFMDAIKSFKVMSGIYMNIEKEYILCKDNKSSTYSYERNYTVLYYGIIVKKGTLTFSLCDRIDRKSIGVNINNTSRYKKLFTTRCSYYITLGDVVDLSRSTDDRFYAMRLMHALHLSIKSGEGLLFIENDYELRDKFVCKSKTYIPTPIRDCKKRTKKKSKKTAESAVEKPNELALKKPSFYETYYAWRDDEPVNAKDESVLNEYPMGYVKSNLNSIVNQIVNHIKYETYDESFEYSNYMFI